jgi:hypothetical protein
MPVFPYLLSFLYGRVADGGGGFRLSIDYLSATDFYKTTIEIHLLSPTFKASLLPDPPSAIRPIRSSILSPYCLCNTPAIIENIFTPAQTSNSLWCWRIFTAIGGIHLEERSLRTRFVCG